MTNQPKPEVSEFAQHLADNVCRSAHPYSARDLAEWLSKWGVADLEARLEAAEREAEDMRICLTWKEFKKMERERDEALGRLEKIRERLNGFECELGVIQGRCWDSYRLATEGGKDG